MIPPPWPSARGAQTALRGPTRQKTARKKESGPALRDRDDRFGGARVQGGMEDLVREKRKIGE
jgi:hypothetical protein